MGNVYETGRNVCIRNAVSFLYCTNNNNINFQVIQLHIYCCYHRHIVKDQSYKCKHEV